MRTRFRAQRDSVFTKEQNDASSTRAKGACRRDVEAEQAKEPKRNVQEIDSAARAAPAALGAQQAVADPTFRPISLAEAVRLAKENNVAAITAANSVRSANNCDSRRRKAQLYPDAQRFGRPGHQRRRPRRSERNARAVHVRRGRTTPA